MPIHPHFCLIKLGFFKNISDWEALKSKAVITTVETLKGREGFGVFLHFYIPGYMGHCSERKHYVRNIHIYLLQTYESSANSKATEYIK